jgi:hypothetical protein
VVEETMQYLRVDGETASPTGSRGQVFVLDGAQAGTLAGVRRLAYDGSELPIDPAEVVTAQVTTRDIDRGDSPHFLLKEIGEAPNSFRKTLRGKIVDTPTGPARRGRRASTARRHRRSPGQWRDHQGACHRAGHRGGRRAQHGGGARHDAGRRRSTSTRSPPPSSPASTCGST